MVRFWLYLLTAALLTGLVACALAPERQLRWAAYYDDRVPAAAFRGMDLVIFDPHHYPKFDALKRKTEVYAYISLGEVREHSPEKSKIPSSLILYHNQQWNSHAVDIRAETWKKLVYQAIEDARKKGFDGVMLDTIDSPLYWAANYSPNQLKDMEDSAIALIRGIRRDFPGLRLILNRGFTILPDVAETLDYALAESIYSSVDISTGQFLVTSPNTYREAAVQLRRTTLLAPHLRILTLDYWNQDDVTGLKRIYAAQRAQGFIPYVSTPDLRRFTPEPFAQPPSG